ncbi:hypothetical protein GCM10027596_13400 [Nocardioides korecus]
MSAGTAPAPTTGSAGRADGGRPGWVGDLLVVLVWFVVLGVVAGVLWWALTPLPEATRVGNAASLDPEQLTGEVAIDGWFAVVATPLGLLSGIALLAWRRRDPLLMVVLTVAGAALASLLMVVLGRVLGPGDVVTALRALPDGGKASVPLKLHAQGVTLLLPAAAALGALVQLWVLRRDEHTEERHGPERPGESGAADVRDDGVEQPHQVGRG